MDLNEKEVTYDNLYMSDVFSQRFQRMVSAKVHRKMHEGIPVQPSLLYQVDNMTAEFFGVDEVTVGICAWHVYV